MLSRRALGSAARLPHRQLTPLALRFSTLNPLQIQRGVKGEIEIVEPDDPEMNGNYQNPPAMKRQFRDPYADWWDKQERRNFGEPVHEDNDILGIFSLEEYTHMTPARGFLLWGGFISAVLGLSVLVRAYYPDRPSAPKEYADGLEAELGGKGALRAWKAEDTEYILKANN